jgi:twitching motility two-component system response regulator PilH
MLNSKDPKSNPTPKTSSTTQVLPRDVAVLLVEDDRSLRRFMEIVLERYGYNVVSASDGLEATELVQRAHVDVIITDAIMPNLDGYEFCRFVKQHHRLNHLPVILLSALEPVGSQRQEPVDAFLTKPVSPDELIACLERVLSQQRV